tara:strand:+ start:360 stop:821 length:462 start_codon:yes stop_codon:yes gene_type:complete
MFLDTLFHINSHHPFKVTLIDIDKRYDGMQYGSIDRAKWKDKNNLRNYVQDHHCIPYQFRNHPLLKLLNFDINCSKNIFMMPNKLAIKNNLFYNENYLVHDGGHVKYNKWVGRHLDMISKSCISLDEKTYLFWLLLNYIRDNMNFNGDNIPWQ